MLTTNKKLADKLAKIYFMFIAYAIVGWLFEGFLWIFKENQLMNRGFLYGPWLPIYGFGGCLIYKFLYRFATTPLFVNKKHNIKPFLTFLLISVSAATVELVSTYLMDLFGFDFKNLWEYSEYRMNFQQRIAFIPSVQFGLLGIFIIYKCQPLISKWIKSKEKVDVIIKVLIGIAFLFDVVIHLFVGNTYKDIPILYF